MKTKIQNIEDLRSELLRLRIKRTEHEKDLKMDVEKITEKFRYPLMLVTKLNDWLGIFAGNDDKEGKKDHDWISNIFRLGLPAIANKFFFPKSGIIMKSLITLVSQKASKTVNKELFTDAINKLSNWIKPEQPGHSRRRVLQDYGIPPDSETY